MLIANHATAALDHLDTLEAPTMSDTRSSQVVSREFHPLKQSERMQGMIRPDYRELGSRFQPLPRVSVRDDAASGSLWIGPEDHNVSQPFKQPGVAPLLGTCKRYTPAQPQPLNANRQSNPTNKPIQPIINQ